MSAQEYAPTIGLEVHCQLATRTKLFSACPYEFGAAPNALTDAYTLALPGSLPSVNRAAVELAIRLALAVGAQIQPISRWDRKHYYYPDLPKGYQITQQAEPFALGGGIEVGGRRIGLTRIHLEEDAGKSIHAGARSLIDFNRAGAPLVEIVGEPVIASAAEAAAYLRELRAVVRALGVSRADMEEGTLRCDANVSIWPKGQVGHGPRCELKNINSFRALELALGLEIARQVGIVAAGGVVRSATLGHEGGRNVILRDKEAAADYRYMPEPDLPALRVDAAWLERVRVELPELPAARRRRYQGLGVTTADAGQIADEPALAAYFDAAVVGVEGEARRVAHWLLGDLLGLLHAHGQEIAGSPVAPAWLAELVSQVAAGSLTGPAAKAVLARSHAEGRSPGQIVAEGGYTRIDDDAAVIAAIDAALAEHPREVAQYRGGKIALRAYFVGLVLRATRGRADPRRVQELLDRALALEASP